MTASQRGSSSNKWTDWRRGWMKTLAVVLVLSFSSMAFTPAAWSQGEELPPDEVHGTPTGAGLQAGSWLLTIPYGAAKITFALLGSVIGGITFLLSAGNLGAAKAVWVTSMYGTYVITPAHLTGDEPVRFLGVEAESTATSQE